MKIKIYSAKIIRAKRKNFQNLEEFENLIKEKLITSPVTHCDKSVERNIQFHNHEKNGENWPF
jgi:hypothetical protein